MAKAATNQPKQTLPKAPSGIAGLDEITGGGLPRGRPTLVCGAAGCGKTLLAMEFLVRGATEFGEPGVFVAFEETAADLTQNVRSLGFDLDALVRRKKLVLDHVRIERSEIEEAGEYDLEGLFIRLGHAIDSIGAKRVAIDTLEVLFGGLADHNILRAELRRLFRWLKDKGVRNTRETSLAKWHATESAFRAAHLAIQVHGAYGYSAEYGIERYFRNARAPIIYEGTTQIHKMMQAEHALGYRNLNGRDGDVSPIASWGPALASR